MKKLLGIVVLGFLFSGNANAGINEPGTEYLGNCREALQWEHKKLKKIYLEKKITDSDVDISEISHQLAELIESIQEHEDRWIELSELSESAK